MGMPAEEVKARITAPLRSLLGDSCAIMSEFPLRPWGGAYADLACLDEDWYGYEIKSAGDSLARFGLQEPAYSSIFDRCVLVCAPKHTAKALKILPEWWALVEAGGDLVNVRPGCVNPYVDATQTASLLRTGEQRAWMVERGELALLRGKRAGLANVIAGRFSLEEIRQQVRLAVQARGGGAGHGA